MSDVDDATQTHREGMDEFEVVDVSEADIDSTVPRTHDHAGNQLYDAFGAPIRKIVRVRDGVRDSEQK